MLKAGGLNKGEPEDTFEPPFCRPGSTACQSKAAGVKGPVGSKLGQLRSHRKRRHRPTQRVSATWLFIVAKGGRLGSLQSVRFAPVLTAMVCNR